MNFKFLHEINDVVLSGITFSHQFQILFSWKSGNRLDASRKSTNQRKWWISQRPRLDSNRMQLCIAHPLSIRFGIRLNLVELCSFRDSFYIERLPKPSSQNGELEDARETAQKGWKFEIAQDGNKSQQKQTKESSSESIRHQIIFLSINRHKLRVWGFRFHRVHGCLSLNFGRTELFFGEQSKFYRSVTFHVNYSLDQLFSVRLRCLQRLPRTFQRTPTLIAQEAHDPLIIALWFVSISPWLIILSS